MTCKDPFNLTMERAKSMGFECFRITEEGALIGYKPLEDQSKLGSGTMFLVNYPIVRIEE